MSSKPDVQPRGLHVPPRILVAATKIDRLAKTKRRRWAAKMVTPIAVEAPVRTSASWPQTLTSWSRRPLCVG